MIVSSERLINDPIISVVVITYNQIKYIRQCIDSILSQKADCSFEVIISDDNSNDGTQDLLREYQSRYPHLIKLLLQENNKGVAHNYFDAVSLARGPFISSIGGDDYWILDSKLQLQKEYMDSHPQCGLCFTNINTCDEEGNVIKERFMDTFPHKLSFECFLVNKGFIAPLTWFFRRELFSHYKIEGAYTDESFALALDAFATSSVDYIDVVTANYRQTVDSLSRNTSEIKAYKQWLGVFKTQMYYSEKYNVDFAIKQIIMFNGYIEFIPMAVSLGDYELVNEAIAFFNSNEINIRPYINTCKALICAEKARKSFSYRLGHLLLSPLRAINKLMLCV